MTLYYTTLNATKPHEIDHAIAQCYNKLCNYMLMNNIHLLLHKYTHYYYCYTAPLQDEFVPNSVNDDGD